MNKNKENCHGCAPITRGAYRNALRGLRHCREQRVVLDSLPLKLYLEPTDICGLRCRYCYPPTEKRQQWMSMELFERIAAQLFDHCCEVNLFLSGEPALAPNLPAMIDACTRRPIITKTFSSLSYRNDALLRQIVQQGVWLNVSFDGEQATRDLRRGSNMELILGNLDRLDQYRRVDRHPRHHLRLAAVVGKHNAPTLPELVDWAAERNFDEVQLGCLDSHPGIDELALDRHDRPHFERAVARADAIGMRISCPSHIGGDPLPRTHNWDDTPLPIDRYFPHFVELLNPDVDRRFCPYPWIQTVLCANGDVVSCCQKKLKIGHLGPGVDFAKDIWNNRIYRGLRSLRDHRGCGRWADDGQGCNMLGYSIWGGEDTLHRIDLYERPLPGTPASRLVLESGEVRVHPQTEPCSGHPLGPRDPQNRPATTRATISRPGPRPRDLVIYLQIVPGDPSGEQRLRRLRQTFAGAAVVALFSRSPTLDDLALAWRCRVGFVAGEREVRVHPTFVQLSIIFDDFLRRSDRLLLLLGRDVPLRRAEESLATVSADGPCILPGQNEPTRGAWLLTRGAVRELVAGGQLDHIADRSYDRDELRRVWPKRPKGGETGRVGFSEWAFIAGRFARFLQRQGHDLRLGVRLGRRRGLSPTVRLAGTSLCTTAMNRTRYLKQALRSWDALGFGEIVIVDWSSDEPVHRALTNLRLATPTRVVRVEGQRFFDAGKGRNLGVRHCRFDRLLLMDSDVRLADLPDPLVLEPGAYLRGHPAYTGPSTDGACLLPRAMFDAVNGVSELMPCWGHEDEDFYCRLRQAGFAERVFGRGILEHIDHPVALKTRHLDQRGKSLQQGLLDNFFVERWTRDHRSRDYHETVHTLGKEDNG